MFNNHIPMILQREKAECGYACIAMLAAYFGCEISLTELQQKFGFYSEGMTLFQVRSILNQLNMLCVALQVPLHELQAITSPVILHWDMNHFVVLKKSRKKYFWIHDPAVGERICPEEEMSRQYTGIVLLAEPDQGFEKMQHNPSFKAWDWLSAIRQGKRVFALLFMLSGLVELGQMLQAFLMQYITDSVIATTVQANLWVIVCGMMLVFTSFAGLDYLRARMAVSLSTQLKTQFLLSSVRHLFTLPLSFFEQRLVGQIQLILQSIEAIQRKCGVELVQGSIELFLMLMNIGVMFCYSIDLSGIVLLNVLVSIVVRYVRMKQLRAIRQMALNHQTKSHSILIETVQMILPIKAYLKELSRWTQWRHAFVETCNSEVRIAQIELNHRVWFQFFLSIEYLLIVCLGAVLIERQQLTLGMLVAFLALRVTFVAKAHGLMQRLADYSLLNVDWEKAQDLFSCPVEQESGCGYPDQSASIKGRLALEEIHYSHNKTQFPLFEGLNLAIDAGEKMVIVGPSGSGKSTLIKIMMGLLQPDSGSIYIDNQAIEVLGVRAYRQQVASVLQEDKLMAGSIRENIVFFEEEIDKPWLEEVVQLIQLQELIQRLPMKYETHLNELGGGISGGEKQRILLARALYKRPKILFLDEATSHLDVNTEQRVNLALKHLQMTQVVVAHRKETIKMADRVVHLNELLQKG